jgi:hypothetical protein
MKNLETNLKDRRKFSSLGGRLIFISLLFFQASYAYGAWEFVTKSPRGDTYYLDSSIVKKGAISNVWGLVDLLEPIQGSSSVKRLYQVDCVKGKLRVNQRLAYTDKGGQGSISSTEKKPGDWIYPDPESINEELLLKICFDKKPEASKH